MRLLPLGGALGAVAFVTALGGCAHLPTYGNSTTPYPTPTPNPSATATPGTCSATAVAGAQVIAITPLITPTTVPTYGIIGGYDLVVNGGVNQIASVLQLKPSDTVQFFNNDTVTGSQVSYSAVGIANVTAFPTPGFTFPPTATAALGTQISATTTWSTGLLGPQCYSQVFTISGAGTYFFGDYTYYSLANIRNVLVSSTSAPQSTIRR